MVRSQQHWIASILAAALVVACRPATTTNQRRGDEMPSPPEDAGDCSPESNSDDGATKSTRGFLIFSNRVEPCSDLGCPADRNTELFRLDFDLDARTFVETRLTDNSDGVPPPSKDTRTVDDDIFIALSADGAALYFTNGLGAAWAVYRTAAAGGTAARITPEGWDIRCDAQQLVFCAWLSVDGNTLYFVSDQDGDNDLYRVDAASGEHLQNLSQNTLDERVEAILPDDSGAIVQTGQRRMDPDNIGLDSELHFLRFSDSTLISYTDNQTFDEPLFFSADGTWFVFEERDDKELPYGESDGPSNLWAVRTDGTEPAFRLTAFTEGSLATSSGGGFVADDTKVVFEFSVPDKHTQIHSVTLSATHPVTTMLTDPPSAASAVFRLFVPSNDDILYTTNDRAGGYGDVEIYKIALDGGDSVLLTSFANEVANLPRAVLDHSGLLVFTSPIGGGDEDLFTIPLTGGPRVNLTQNEHEDRFLTVSSDEAWLFFENSSDDLVPGSPYNDSDIYAVPTSGGETLQLTANRVTDTVHAAFWK